jgi:uncharacterized protein (TIGR02145 family)
MATRNLGNVRALISSATPPTNKNLIWQDTSSIPYTKKVWNNNLLIWEPINPSESTGEENTASNVGLGSGLYKEKVGVDLRFKSLSAGTNVSISEQQDQVVISSSGKHSIENEGTGVTPANILNFLGFVITYDSVNGKIVIDKGEPSNTIVQTLTELQAITGYKDGNSVLVVDEFSWYKFNAGSESGTKPDDGGTGSWIQYAEFSGLVSDSIHNTTEKPTPVDADEFGIWGSVSSALRKVTWANIKATLKTYFDTLYVSVTDVTSQMIANWNEAYGWGDHAAEGYLTTETDPVFTAHPASNVIDTGDGDKYLADDGIYRFVESGDTSLWEPDTISGATTEHPRWNDSGDPNIYGTDKFGFGALPAGHRYSDGTYYLIGTIGEFWTKTLNEFSNPIGRQAENDNKSIVISNRSAKEGLSLRLVRPYAPADGDKIDGRILYDTFSDYDGNTYDGVIIGDQVWSTTNLKTTSYADGTPILTGYNNTDWSNLTTGAYAVYDYNLVSGIDSEDEMITAYGLLYNWYAVDNALGLATNGSVPTDAEFTQLTDYLIATYPEIDSTNVGDYLKSVRQVNSPFEYESDEILRPKENLSGERRKILAEDIVDGNIKSYTIDFQTTSYSAMDINMFGAGTITEITTQNIASIVVTYSGGVQQAVNPADPALSIEAGDNLYWEITRTTDGEPAAMGVKLELN